MADSERRRRGVEMMKKVYAGDVAVPPEGASAFADVMLEQLFAEVGTCESAAVITDRATGRSRGFGFVGSSQAS